MSTRLFLASEAKHPESMKKLEIFVGGFAGRSLAYIPTANNGEHPYEAWKTESSSWKLVQTLGMDVTAVQLEDYKNQEAIELLRGKDIIWFAGGATGYLLYWIRRCQIDKTLPELLRNGAVYVGSSAGSMVAAPTLELTEWYFRDQEPGAGCIPGLGLVDFEIYPHFEDADYKAIEQRFPGGELYLLKNGEAITVVDEKIEVLGEKRLIKK